MRSWRNATLLTASLGLSLLLGEVIVRVFLGNAVVLFPRYQAVARYDQFTIRRLRPETTFWHTSADGSWEFTVDREGFRDSPDFSYAHGSSLRVFALGDSQTQGFEVRQDHTYAAVMEKYLDGHGLKAEIINAGVSGFGTAEEEIFLEHAALKDHPDVIVLGFYANDFADTIKSDLFRLKDDNKLTVHKSTHVPGTALLKLHNSFTLLRWLSENSYLYSLVMNTVWETAKRALRSRKLAEMTTELAVATGEADGYQKRLTVRLIERMYRLCKERLHPTRHSAARRAGGVLSSIPSDLLDEFEANSDELIRSEEVLSPYRHLAEFSRTSWAASHVRVVAPVVGR